MTAQPSPGCQQQAAGPRSSSLGTLVLTGILQKTLHVGQGKMPKESWGNIPAGLGKMPNEKNSQRKKY